MTAPTSEEFIKLQQAVARDLPGWRLSQPEPTRTPPHRHARVVGDLDALRHKMHAGGASLSNPLHATAWGVLVAPIGGGPTKVADIVNGRATIVQG